MKRDGRSPGRFFLDEGDMSVLDGYRLKQSIDSLQKILLEYKGHELTSYRHQRIMRKFNQLVKHIGKALREQQDTTHET